MIAFFDHSEPLAADISTFYFRSEKKLDFLAGQYAEVIIPKINESQWYTLSSSPSEELLAITTKYQTPLSNFKETLKGLKKNESINIFDAIGDFVLPKDLNVPIIYISGGIGITPVRSIIKSLKDSRQKRNIQLIYIVKDKLDFIYDDLFRSYGMTYTPIVTHPTKDWHGESGEITSKRVLSLARYDQSSLFFVSGPQRMVESMCAGLEQKILRSHIVMDYFPGYLDL